MIIAVMYTHLYSSLSTVILPTWLDSPVGRALHCSIIKVTVSTLDQARIFLKAYKIS